MKVSKVKYVIWAADTSRALNFYRQAFGGEVTVETPHWNEVVVAGATIGEIREQHLQRGRIDYLKVLSVEPGSFSDASGFLVGDIIYSINKQLTRSFDEVFAIVDSNGKGMIMNIQRGNRELYILLR